MTDITDNELKKKELELKYQMNDLIGNAMLSRSSFLSKLMDPRRDIDDECGYKRPCDITLEDYQDMYDAESTARRVVNVLPMESWKIQPTIFETEDVDNETPFEADWKNLNKSLRGEKSWYQDEEGSPIWEYLLRVDILSGLGFYGALLIGVDDGKELLEPLEPKDGLKVIYLRCFTNKLARIANYVDDPNNSRYGKPEYYNVYFTDPTASQEFSAGETIRSQKVHWTRINHVADGLESSEVFAVPRMRPVFNRLYDLRKTYGGSAEMYWQGAFPGLSFETHPQLGADIDIPETDLREAMEQYKNGLQRYLAIAGVTAKSLAPQVVDPSPQIDKYLESICISIGVPKRVFMGSERGELSSGQDKNTWNERLKFRQDIYITPRLIVPFVDWLITYGVLSEPDEGYSVRWPDLGSLDGVEKATVLVQETEAMAKYVGGNVDQLIAPLDYLTRFMGKTDEEAQEIIDASIEYVGEQDEADALEREAELERIAELGLEPQQFQSEGGAQFGKPETVVVEK